MQWNHVTADAYTHTQAYIHIYTYTYTHAHSNMGISCPPLPSPPHLLSLCRFLRRILILLFFLTFTHSFFLTHTDNRKYGVYIVGNNSNPITYPEPGSSNMRFVNFTVNLPVSVGGRRWQIVTIKHVCAYKYVCFEYIWLCMNKYGFFD